MPITFKRNGSLGIEQWTKEAEIPIYFKDEVIEAQRNEVT